MEEITVRPARPSDLKTLLRYEQGIISWERPYDPTLAQDPIHYYDLKELIESPQAEVVVALVEKKIVGSGYAKIKQAQPYLDHTYYSYLGFMFTDPDYRGKGVNKAIIDALKKWSFNQGLKEIRLTVYPDNLGAVKAYEKVGFTKHLLEMRLDKNMDK